MLSRVVSPESTRRLFMPLAFPKRISVCILSPTMQVRSDGTPNARATHAPMTVYGLPQMTEGVLPDERSKSARKDPTSGIGTPAVGHTSSGWVAKKLVEPLHLGEIERHVVRQHADFGRFVVERNARAGELRAHRVRRKNVHLRPRMMLREIFDRRHGGGVNGVSLPPKSDAPELFLVFVGRFGRVVREIHQLFSAGAEPRERIAHFPDGRFVQIDGPVEVEQK